MFWYPKKEIVFSLIYDLTKYYANTTKQVIKYKFPRITEHERSNGRLTSTDQILRVDKIVKNVISGKYTQAAWLFSPWYLIKNRWSLAVSFLTLQNTNPERVFIQRVKIPQTFWPITVPVLSDTICVRSSLTCHDKDNCTTDDINWHTTATPCES